MSKYFLPKGVLMVSAVGPTGAPPIDAPREQKKINSGTFTTIVTTPAYTVIYVAKTCHAGLQKILRVAYSILSYPFVSRFKPLLNPKDVSSAVTKMSDNGVSLEEKLSLFAGYVRIATENRGDAPIVTPLVRAFAESQKETFQRIVLSLPKRELSGEDAMKQLEKGTLSFQELYLAFNCDRMSYETPKKIMGIFHFYGSLLVKRSPSQIHYFHSLFLALEKANPDLCRLFSEKLFESTKQVKAKEGEAKVEMVKEWLSKLDHQSSIAPILSAISEVFFTFIQVEFDVTPYVMLDKLLCKDIPDKEKQEAYTRKLILGLPRDNESRDSLFVKMILADKDKKTGLYDNASQDPNWGENGAFDPAPHIHEWIKGKTFDLCVVKDAVYALRKDFVTVALKDDKITPSEQLYALCKGIEEKCSNQQFADIFNQFMETGKAKEKFFIVLERCVLASVSDDQKAVKSEELKTIKRDGYVLEHQRDSNEIEAFKKHVLDATREVLSSNIREDVKATRYEDFRHVLKILCTMPFADESTRRAYLQDGIEANPYLFGRVVQFVATADDYLLNSVAKKILEKSAEEETADLEETPQRSSISETLQAEYEDFWKKGARAKIPEYLGRLAGKLQPVMAKSAEVLKAEACGQALGEHLKLAGSSEDFNWLVYGASKLTEIDG